MMDQVIANMIKDIVSRIYYDWCMSNLWTLYEISQSPRVIKDLLWRCHLKNT